MYLPNNRHIASLLTPFRPISFNYFSRLIQVQTASTSTGWFHSLLARPRHCPDEEADANNKPRYRALLGEARPLKGAQPPPSSRSPRREVGEMGGTFNQASGGLTLSSS